MYGTWNFVSLESARCYYARRGIGAEGVAAKLLDGDIAIGAPEVRDGERVVITDDGTRYAVDGHALPVD